MARTILVTGATGNRGLGSLALARRSCDGIHVRAAVRDLKKGAALAAPGVEPILFDYDKPDTFAAACQGVDAVFLVAPFACRSRTGSSRPRSRSPAARAAGVGHIVKLGVSRSLGDITVGRWHAAIDAALKDSGVAWTLLLPGGFMQNFLKNSAPHPDGNMYLPVGDAKASFIDVRDIAEVAPMKALTEPGASRAEEYTLTGPEDVSYAEAAAMMSEASGRQIRFVDVPEAAARQGMLRLPATCRNGWWMSSSNWNAWFKASGGSGNYLDRPGCPRASASHLPRLRARDYAQHWKGLSRLRCRAEARRSRGNVGKARTSSPKILEERSLAGENSQFAFDCFTLCSTARILIGKTILHDESSGGNKRSRDVSTGDPPLCGHPYERRGIDLRERSAPVLSVV